MKAYLESNHGPRQLLVECEQPLKAKVLEVHYGKLHMDYYHFYQQCEDNFETVGATRTNRTTFAALFSCRNTSVCWV